MESKTLKDLRAGRAMGLGAYDARLTKKNLWRAVPQRDHLVRVNLPRFRFVFFCHSTIRTSTLPLTGASVTRWSTAGGKSTC